MGLIPAEHQHGETIVTFTISDGVDWTRKQLRLTVNAVNDKPTFVVNPDLSPVTIEGVSGGQAVVGNLSVTEDPGGIEVESGFRYCLSNPSLSRRNISWLWPRTTPIRLIRKPGYHTISLLIAR